MFKSLIDLGKNVVDVVKAPVEVAIDSARIITQPLAELSNEIVKEVKVVADDVKNDFESEG